MAVVKTTTVLLALLTASLSAAPAANATGPLAGAAYSRPAKGEVQLAHRCPVCGYRMVYKRVRWFGQWVRVWWCPDDC